MSIGNHAYYPIDFRAILNYMFIINDFHIN